MLTLSRRHCCEGRPRSFRACQREHGTAEILQLDIYGCPGSAVQCQICRSRAYFCFQMPNLDGIQSTRLIREMGYSAPIVALTAFAEESNVKECMDSGMDFFLPKPIRRPALKQVLKRYCATIPEAAEESEKDGWPAKKNQSRQCHEGRDVH